MTAKHILVTRPQSQGAALSARLREHGFTVTHVPVMEIALLEAPQQAMHVDALVFVSVNAAEAALPWLKKYPPAPTTDFFAVGKTTAQFLDAHFPSEKRSSAHTIFPRQEMNSEGLLALPELQAARIAGKHFRIVRGEGGRELIAETLAARGALVESVSLYRRIVPLENTAPLQQALPETDIIVVNSGESLDHLLTLCGNRERVLDKTLLVPGERVAHAARNKGFRHIITSSNATDDAVVSALSAYCEEPR